jgi:CHAT domain-containing protein
MIKHSKKILLTLVTLSLFVLTLIIYRIYLPKSSPIVRLQKSILLANTLADTQKVVAQLDNHYLEMHVPDSIKQRIEAEVDRMIEEYEYGKLDITPADQNANSYLLEIRLADLLRDAMIARVRHDEPTIQKAEGCLKILEEAADDSPEFDYWRSRITAIASLDADQARNWLLAEKASRACKDNHLTNFSTAEIYGAWGVQLLKQSDDVRLRLDIIQRLMTILYRSYGMYNLSFVVAQKALRQADEIGYHLRASGIVYNFANALRLAGEKNQALKYFQETIRRADTYNFIPAMNWYKKNGLIGVAKAKWQLLDYHEVLSICVEVEAYDLTESERIEIPILRGIAHRNLGNYDLAEANYNQALGLAEQFGDTENQIIILKDLGTFYYRLTEYDRAELYYNKAMKLHRDYNPNNFERRITLLISIAENQAEKNEMAEFRASIDQASALIAKINQPVVGAELSRLVGRLNFKMKKYQEAFDNFGLAVKIYENNGLLRAALETRNKLIECLIPLAKYRQAAEILDGVISLAAKIHDSQRLIDAIEMKADIAHKQGDLDKAIQASNRLINEVEFLSSRLKNIDNLTTFHQKVHDYLRRAVMYELEKGRTDSAFVKADYMKARALKNKHVSDDNEKSLWQNSSNFINIDTLKAHLSVGQLLINYLVTQDTLYAFVANNKTFCLLKKPLKIEQLKKSIDDYMKANIETYTIFKAHQPENEDRHYDSIMTLGNSLYKILLDWPELQLELKNANMTYIIPDDILYEVPFACLIDEESKFLVNNTAIAYLPSAIFVQYSQNKKIRDNISHKKVLISSANHKFRAASNLVAFIKNQFPLAKELVIDKPVITKEDILSKLKKEQYDIYVFLGHSEADTIFSDSCYFEITALREDDLSPTTIKATLAEIKKIDWSHAETVLLIGCETAVGKLYKGTGIVGIQQGILAAGAKEVLASLWAIDAKHAIPQIKNLFTYLDDTVNTAFALQQVQVKKNQSLKEDISYRNPFPYFWAGFTIYQTETVCN